MAAHHRPPRPAGARPGPARLPWWAVALPAAAFAVLLAAAARTGHTDPVAAARPLTELLGRLRGVFAHALADRL